MMKLKMTTAILGAAAFGAVAAFAGEKNGDGDWEAKLEAKFAEIDADADGSVSEAEYLAYKAEEAKKSFAEMGGDDGSVTLDEAKQAYAAKVAEKEAMKKEMPAAEAAEGEPQENDGE